jgi:trk system potassium uptake protein TrkA
LATLFDIRGCLRCFPAAQTEKPRVLMQHSKRYPLKIIIVGAGEVGFYCARRLAAESKEVVVIDRDPTVLTRLQDVLDIQILEGSGSNPEVLKQAGLKDADIFLAVTDSDETNLTACTFANILSPGITKLARIRNQDILNYQNVLNRELHLGTIINPELEVVKTIEGLLGTPGATDLSEFAGGRIKLLGLWIGEQNEVAGIGLMDLRRKTGDLRFIVAAIIRGNDLIIPTGTDHLRAGDLVHFVCEDKDVPRLLGVFGSVRAGGRNVLIVGGGNIGFTLANALESRSVNVKLLDMSNERCEFLAEHLDKTIVLHGDGTDKEILEEENVQDLDAVITVTGSEETNILASLLAKSLGVAKCITRINKSAYMPLVRAIGLEHIVSPRLSAVNSLLKHVRKGQVIASISIKDEAEALEAIALDKSALVGKPIKDLPFPRGAIVLGIMRGDTVIIPTGDDIIQPDDRVILLATRNTISKVEKALTVTLEQL